MAEDKATIEAQAADVDLTAPLVQQAGYIESKDHTPNPYFQTGTLETTDLGSTPQQQLNGVSPIFEIARAENLRTAARALDPNDTSVSSDLVILPAAQVTVQGSERSAEDAAAEVFGAVRRLIDEPVMVGVSPAAQEAARGVAPEDVDDTISDDEQARMDDKKEAQEAEEQRLADVRASSAQPTAPASSGPDSGQPAAGTSSTPSANPARAESGSSASTSSTARKSTTTTSKGTTK